MSQTVAEGIKEAVKNDDHVRAGRISNYLNMKGLKYDDVANLFKKYANIGVLEYEDLMYRSDIAEGQEL